MEKRPDCKKCCSYENCEFRKRNEICWEFPFLGEWVYTWDGTSGNM